MPPAPYRNVKKIRSQFQATPQVTNSPTRVSSVKSENNPFRQFFSHRMIQRRRAAEPLNNRARSGK